MEEEGETLEEKKLFCLSYSILNVNVFYWFLYIPVIDYIDKLYL